MNTFYLMIYRSYIKRIHCINYKVKKIITLISIELNDITDDEEFLDKISKLDFRLIAGELSEYEKFVLNDMHKENDYYWYFGIERCITFEHIDIDDKEKAIEYFKIKKEENDEEINKMLLMYELGD